MKSKLYLLEFTIISFVIQTAMPGDMSNTRGVGMARTINAASRGIDAVGINPANISIPDKGFLNINLVPSSARVSTEILTFDLYKEYFTGVDSVGERWAKRLEPADKEKILNQMPDLPVTRVRAEVMIFGASFLDPIIGGIGFGMIDHAGADVKLSKDFFRMAAFGLEPAGSVYVFDGTEANAWWYREYNLSYGRKLPVNLEFLNALYTGIGVKLLHGFGISKSIRQTSSFGNYPDELNPLQYTLVGSIDFLTTHTGADYMHENSNENPNIIQALFPAPVGKGIGFDIGFSGEFVNGMRASMSVTDIGKIKWNKNVIESYNSKSVAITGNFSHLEDTLDTMTKGKTRPGEAFETKLPSALRIGFETEASKIPGLFFMPDNFIIAFDYLQGFNESLGNTTKPRFSLGTEYYVLSMLPLRTGIAFGGDDKVRWSFGFGIDLYNFSLDFASDNFGTVFIPNSFQTISLSIGMKVRV
ncbi:MAG: hypothetical protein JXA06_02550 [Bacteroidetes bacterium]|nr:hypothetical protein [Bacteroidota bacterium]